jgi:predicted restriction endonuclease
MDTQLSSSPPPSLLERLLTPVGDCLTPDVARHLVDLHASADVQARLEELADKCTEGQLSAEERAEYETAVAAIEFISVLQECAASQGTPVVEPDPGMIDAATRRLVRERAGNRCEYCGISQAQQSFPAFHIDHIIAQQHGGTDDPANLALSCYHWM